MANSFGMIDEALWRRDAEFRKLTRSAQCTFVQLLSQRDLDCAGVLTLHVELLAKACDELTRDQVHTDLAALEEAGFVYVDCDTDELLIRSYVRRPAARAGNMLKAACKAARAISSPKLRTVLSRELRRLNKADATACADEIDAGWTPSEAHPDPVRSPSEAHPERVAPSKPLRSTPSVDTSVATSPSVDGYFGGARTRAQARDDNPAGQSPPNATCPKHPDGTADSCGGCADARRTHDAWQAARAQAARDRDRAEAAQRVNATQAAADAIWACPLCDDAGYRLPDCRSVCDHEDRADTNRNGIAKVRSALKDATHA